MSEKSEKSNRVELRFFIDYRAELRTDSVLNVVYSMFSHRYILYRKTVLLQNNEL